MPEFSVSQSVLERIVRAALDEDVGVGDVTTVSTVEADAQARAIFVCKSSGVLAGSPVATEVFRQIDDGVRVLWTVADGSEVLAGETLGEVNGPARAILTGERVALNFLQRLSGIATLTSHFVKAVEGTSARITDTRKTTPGLRALEKYAVVAGGGFNHRMGLYDAVLIKDNHIVASGGITAAVELARRAIPHTMTISVECEALEQVVEALDAGAHVLLLDNMDARTLRQAVRVVRRKAITEASGGISLRTVGKIARTGVDVLSIGALTHSAPAMDISLDLELVTGE